ncbi:MAG: hypothetical protein ACXVKA_02195 [Acidimicrobiia bacterium]
MVQRTSTDFAPWTLVPSNDKRFSRMTVLRTIFDELAKHLREPRDSVRTRASSGVQQSHPA